MARSHDPTGPRKARIPLGSYCAFFESFRNQMRWSHHLEVDGAGQRDDVDLIFVGA